MTTLPSHQFRTDPWELNPRAAAAYGLAGALGAMKPVPLDSDSRRAPWKYVLTGGVAVLGVLAVLGSFMGTAQATFDPSILNRDIGNQMAAKLAPLGITGVSVDCPSGQKARTGNIFDCRLSAAGQTGTLRVTADDDKGHYSSQAVEPIPGVQKALNRASVDIDAAIASLATPTTARPYLPATTLATVVRAPTPTTITASITYSSPTQDRELSALKSELARLHSVGAVTGDDPSQVHSDWEDSLARFCRAHGGTLHPILTKAPSISSPQATYCSPPTGKFFTLCSPTAHATGVPEMVKATGYDQNPCY